MVRTAGGEELQVPCSGHVREEATLTGRTALVGDVVFTQRDPLILEEVISAMTDHMRRQTPARFEGMYHLLADAEQIAPFEGEVRIMALAGAHLRFTTEPPAQVGEG
jgi:hypothetical protein